MEDQLYREALLERYSNPVNQGVIEKPDLEAKLSNPLCGDEVRLQFRLSQGIISQTRFAGNGCVLSQVSASLVAEYSEGKALAEIEQVSLIDILSLLGVTPNPARLKCVTLSLDTLKKALHEETKD